jgi:hypothetical protein
MKRPRRQRNDGLRKICGCRRTNWPKCAHGWHFSFYHKRRAYRFSLDKEVGHHVDSKSAAEAEADRIGVQFGAAGMASRMRRCLNG